MTRTSTRRSRCDRSPVNETIQRVCRSEDGDPEECDLFCGFTLPQLGRAADRKEPRHLIRDNGVGVVIVDPLYPCMGGGERPVSASNLYEVGPVLAKFAGTCLRAGATPIFPPHTVKATSSKTTAVALNDLAFTGIGEFARQWVLVGRTAEYRPGSGAHDLILSIGGRAGHSSCRSVRVDEGRDAENRR